MISHSALINFFLLIVFIVNMRLFSKIVVFSKLPLNCSVE